MRRLVWTMAAVAVAGLFGDAAITSGQHGHGGGHAEGLSKTRLEHHAHRYRLAV